MTHFNKKSALLLILVALAITVIFIFNPQRLSSDLKTIKINDAQILVEITDSPSMRAKGLSGRTSLPQNQGMLFIFKTPGQYSFWMKEMLFPLDFVWIKGGAIVQIDKNIKPQDYQPPNSLAPRQEINQVLELNAGTAERLNIKVGDKIEF